MTDQKMDNLLNLALSVTPQEREKSRSLSVGYSPGEDRWQVVVKYSGSAEGLGGENIQVSPLLGGYAVVSILEKDIGEYARRPQIAFMEMPKELYFQDYAAREASCIPPVQTGPPGLTGKGVLIGIVDSGDDGGLLPGRTGWPVDIW